MDQMIETDIVNMLVDGAYSKIVNHPENVAEEGFDELFQTFVLSTIDTGGDNTKATMIKVQAKEAAEEGYLQDINGSEDDNVEAVEALLSTQGIDMVFDITDKGKKHFLPLVKDQIKERLRIVVEELDKAIPTDDALPNNDGKGCNGQCMGGCNCEK